MICLKKTPRTTFIFLLVLIGLHLCFCQGKDSGKQQPYSSDQLKKLLDEYLEDKTNVLGTIVKVDINGERSYQAASGYLNLSRTIPIKVDTPFIIGSVSKIFTAVLVHQLIEKGIVQPDVPLIKYLPPDWSAVLAKIRFGSEITVIQALSHRSGIGDMTESEEFWKSLASGAAGKLDGLDYMRQVQKTRKAKFRPGENFDYANANYILLGAMIEHASKMPYTEVLRRNILDHIGLKRTYPIKHTLAAHQETIAHGYTPLEGKMNDGTSVGLDWALAAGGLISSADDLIRFYRALISGDLFADKKTYEKMIRNVGHNESYGQGLEVFNDPDLGVHYGHKGSLLNTRSILAYFPDQQITICICHSYEGFSMLDPRRLMKSVVLSIKGEKPASSAAVDVVGPDIFADTSAVVINKDIPLHGEWDFDLKEEWRLHHIDGQPLIMPGALHTGDDGKTFMINQGLAQIVVLDPKGKLLARFGGHGDGPLFEYPLDLFVTSGYIHVLDMAKTGDKIKTYDQKGKYIKTSLIKPGISPRTFISNDRYIAVRSGPDILKRPNKELLEILSLEKKVNSVITTFPAEDKLVLTAYLPRGRYIFLENNIELFPRLIVHADNDRIFLGRSDRYLIKKTDLTGREQLAFSIENRASQSLPADYAANRADTIRIAGNHKMPEEMKKKFLSRFPKRHTHFTRISTDKQGFIYIFVPDIMERNRQRVDIFSSAGRYLYRSVIALPQGLRTLKSCVLNSVNVYVLASDKNGRKVLVKFRITKPT